MTKVLVTADVISVVKCDTNEVLASFDKGTPDISNGMAELMSYLCNENYFQHQHGTVGILKINGQYDGVYDLSDRSLFYKLQDYWYDGDI